MEEPARVQVVDDVGKICKIFAVLVFLLFLCMGSDGDAAIVFIYSLFCVMILVVIMTFCSAYYQGTGATEEVAQRAAANAAVMRLGQPSLTAGVMSDEAQAASSAPNNTNTSNASGIANVSYGFGDNPRAVRLTLVIEGDGHVRLAPMPVEQASALRPVNERVGLGAGAEGGGEHVAGVPLASYSTQVQIHNSNNNDGNASHGGGAGRGGGEEGAQYVGHDREGTCEAAAGEGGNEMSDDALYGRGAYIPCTTADVNAAASAATEVVMVPVEQTAQEMQPSSSQAAAAAAEDHEEEEDVAKKPAAEANAEV